MNSTGFARVLNDPALHVKKKVNFGRQEPVEDKPCRVLTASPQSISFNSYDSEQLYISKFTIKNNSRCPIGFKIIPPKNSVFTLKHEQKLQIAYEQTFEVYVHFKSNKTKTPVGYRDEVVVAHDGGSLTVQLNARPPLDPRRFSLVLCEEDSNNPLAANFKRRLVSSKLTSAKRVALHKTLTHSQLMFEDSNSSLQSQRFLQKYQDLWEAFKERKPMIHAFSGNEPLTKDYIDSVLSERQAKLEKEQQEAFTRIRNRFALNLTDECPVVDRGQNRIVRWNETINDQIKIKANGTKKLLECIWQCITNFRVEKARQAWEKYLDLPGDSAEVMQVVRHDIQLATRNSRKLQVDCRLQFQKKMLKPKELPMQLKKFGVPSYNGGNFIIEVNPRIGFDDWIPMEELSQNYHEIMGYTRASNSTLPQVCINLGSAITAVQTSSEKFEEELAECRTEDIEYQELQMLPEMPAFALLEPPELDCPLELFELSESTEDTFAQEPSNFLGEAARSLTGINFQLCHYVHHRLPSEFDCAFLQNLQQHVDSIIGEPELDDQLRVDWNELPPVLQRLAGLCAQPQPPEAEWFQPVQPNLYHSTYKQLQHELSLLKHERLRTFNAYIRSYNKFIRAKEHKIIF